MEKMYKKNLTDRRHGIFAKSLAITQGIWYNTCYEEIDGGTMQLTRNVNDLVTIECAKARVFVDSLANASFFLNFG